MPIVTTIAAGIARLRRHHRVMGGTDHLRRLRREVGGRDGHKGDTLSGGNRRAGRSDDIVARLRGDELRPRDGGARSDLAPA